MIRKKILVHGTEKSLAEFFTSPFNAGYEPLAILTDEKNFAAVRTRTGEGGEIFTPETLPKFIYRLIDGIVLTDKETAGETTEFFLQNGLEPRKIILCNNTGVPEYFSMPDKDGVPVFFMEGLEFHIRKPDDENFFKNLRFFLQQQKIFYAINPTDYPKAIEQRYQNIFGKKLDWNNLQTWSEKMHRVMLEDSTPLKTRLADKFLVRSYIEEKIGAEYLIPLLGVWEKFDDIDFENLPDKFALKCNHGSGMNIICRDKSNFDFENAREKINAWLSIDYGTATFELHYKDIKKKIIAEKFMTDGKNFDLTDYKFYCFNGKPMYCQIETNRSFELCIDYFDMNFNRMNFERSDHPDSPNPEKFRKPKNFKLMKKLAEKLSKEFIFVRVDFYEIEGKVYAGELTFVPGAAGFKFKSEGTDELWGSLMTLPEKF